MLDETIAFHDKRQFNTEADNAYMTIAIFIYGFAGVIAFISLLNIVNTMNTSVVSKTKYLGIMRAVGMSGKQLTKMILAQSITYSLMGCTIGSVLGILLQRGLLDFFEVEWMFPLWQIISVFMFCILSTVLSIISPLARIKARGISETISSL
jgi:putative ABC transport system permease protein